MRKVSEMRGATLVLLIAGQNIQIDTHTRCDVLSASCCRSGTLSGRLHTNRSSSDRNHPCGREQAGECGTCNRMLRIHVVAYGGRNHRGAHHTHLRRRTLPHRPRIPSAQPSVRARSCVGHGRHPSQTGECRSHTRTYWRLVDSGGNKGVTDVQTKRFRAG